MIGIVGLLAIPGLGLPLGWSSLHFRGVEFPLGLLLPLLWASLWVYSAILIACNARVRMEQRLKPKQVLEMAFCVTFVLGSIALWKPLTPFQWSLRARMAAFHRLAERSAPLVEAIRQYERDHGSAPNDLALLVPEYLDEVPGTGMWAYPDHSI